MSVVDQAVAPDFVLHDPASPTGELRGPEGFKQNASTARTAFPDLHLTIEEQIAEGDEVVTRLTMQGTRRGALPGSPPTGKQATWTGLVMQRYAGGKLVETGPHIDDLGLLQQLGALPQMASRV